MSGALFSWSELPYLSFNFFLESLFILYFLRCCSPMTFLQYIFTSISQNSPFLLSCWFFNSVHYNLPTSSGLLISHHSFFSCHTPLLLIFLLLFLTQRNSRALHQADVRHLSECRLVLAWLIFGPPASFVMTNCQLFYWPCCLPLCHSSIQRLNLWAWADSVLSCLSSDRIYVSKPYSQVCLPCNHTGERFQGLLF